MKGMRDLNNATGKKPVSLVVMLLVFGIICIGIGIGVAANWNLLSQTRADNVPTSLSNEEQLAENSGVGMLFKTQESFREIISKAKPAVVTIETKKEAAQMPFQLGPGDQYFFFDPFKREKSAPKGDEEKNYDITGGSGFFVSPDGYILTNNHVVSDAIEITVIADNQKTYKAELIGTDPMTDVALLKISGESNFSYLELGNSENAQIGDWVIAIGSPIRLAQTVTVGVISGKNREDVKVGDIDYSNFIQTDAAINFGNSGGPLLDIFGKVIGINTAIAGGANVTGIGFAIPSNLAKFAFDNLKAHGEVIRAWIGVTIQPVDAGLAEAYGLDKPKGALINTIVKGDPADKAGLRVGDLIVSIDGKEVPSSASLSRMIAEKPIGKPVQLKVLRKDKTISTLNVSVTPAQRPEDAQAKVMSPSQSQQLESPIGLTVDEISPEARKQLSIPEEITGVLITNVKRNSVAADKMLFQYDIVTEIDNTPVRSVTDYKSVMSNAKKVALFKIARQNVTGAGWTSLYIAVPIEK